MTVVSMDLDESLPAELLRHVESLGMREFKTLIGIAVGRVLEAGRRRVEANDFRRLGAEVVRAQWAFDNERNHDAEKVNPNSIMPRLRKLIAIVIHSQPVSIVMKRRLPASVVAELETFAAECECHPSALSFHG
ncbi:hypothetical protein LP414_24935 [Polaromonas sp. P1(28)-13]|nr:hypothetical protein LP414_24935 [Polaromonas sp. P1(28)-13]